LTEQTPLSAARVPSIGPYPHQRPAGYQTDDRRAREVAARVAQLVRNQLPTVALEHIGSTAVEGLGGKGIIDLMILFQDEAELAAIKRALADLGFQPQRGRDPWPEDRPMRTGSIEHAGTAFLLHVHVIPAGSPEVGSQRRFRDRLRADAALREAYMTEKRAILASGITDSIEYSKAKHRFISGAIEGDSATP
jgi:GrpB-like predicted nucleotidyltransferase (UPF0157 family)